MPAPAATTCTAGPAQRTGEWRQGIDRLLDMPPPALGRYLGFIRALGLYPGSPALIRAMLRPDDRLVCCELHPDDLRIAPPVRPRSPGRGAPARRLGGARRPAAAAGAPRPGADRSAVRGPRRIHRLAAGLATAHARFRTGVLAAWYPIKHRAPVRGFLAAMQQTGIRDVVAAELCLREPLRPGAAERLRLAGGQPAVPVRAGGPLILQALLDRLGTQRARRLRDGDAAAR